MYVGGFECIACFMCFRYKFLLSVFRNWVWYYSYWFIWLFAVILFYYGYLFKLGCCTWYHVVVNCELGVYGIGGGGMGFRCARLIGQDRCDFVLGVSTHYVP